MHNWLVTTESKQLHYYEGLLIHADEGMHEQLFDLFCAYVQRNSSILDIGAGAGAFTLRLKNGGYKVKALDIDPDKWNVKGIEFLVLDINQGIAGSVEEQFDAVCCQEVIEHVENPWALLRDIFDVLKPGGVAIVSTPNITSFLSRIVFFRKGEFHQFQEADLSYGHISPISHFQMVNMARNCGFQIIHVQPGGYLPVFDLSQINMKSVIMNMLRGIAYILTKGEKRGWTLIYVLRKPDNQTSVT